jgi:ABC-type Mn2+/Zn2+ transport system permease subunit
MPNSLEQLVTLFPNALGAGLLIAVTCSCLGVFVILKRVVFIGITLSEVAALGIALAMTWHFPPLLGAAVLTLAAVSLFALPYEMQSLPREAAMGLVFVLASALSILVVARSGMGLHQVRSLLYGDLILTSPTDLALMAAVMLPALAALLLFLRPVLYTFLDREAARVMGMKVFRWELLYFCCLGLAVSAASKVAGALLVFCYLVAPPAAGLLLSRRLGWVMFIASLLGALATVAGLTASIASDLPANQTIVATNGACFLACLLFKGISLLAKRLKHEHIGSAA